MKRLKVLLISPNILPFEFAFEVFMYARSYFPMSLGRLASFIEKHGYEAKILDAYTDNFSQKDIHAAIKEFAPDVVGMASPTNHEFGLDTIRACKGINPKIVTVLGGLTPTFMPRKIMEHVPELDHIISGEGEIPFLYLLRALEGEMRFEEIKGLVHRKDRGTVVVNEGRYRVEDLDSLSFPSRDCFLTKSGVPYFMNKRFNSIEASRGCYHSCTFCVVNEHFGEGVRYRSPRSVVDELRECVKKYRTKAFRFLDSTFTADSEYTHRLLDEIIKSDIHMKFRFTCMTRLDCVDDDLLKKMKAANCRRIAYGVESHSQKVLDAYHKDWQAEKTMDVFDKTKKAGMETAAWLMLNQYDPAGETEIKRQADDLLAFVKKLRPYRFAVSPMIISPNAPMYDEILREGGIDADGYKELFNRRHIPSRRISNREIERSILKVYLASFKNQVQFAIHNVTATSD